MSTLQTEENHIVKMALPLQQMKLKTTVFDLSWDDIFIPLICKYLSLKDIFNLRCCSREAKRFAEYALEYRKEIHLSGNKSKKIDLAFAVMALHCEHLESLQLARCYWLTDSLLLPMLKKNHRLKVVNLNECTNLTPSSLQPIIIRCKNLRVLKLAKCNWLTTGAVDALTLHQNNIEEFDISHCPSIGERCLTIFFRKLRKLTVLSLANTQSVTDHVLLQIATSCRDLEHINLVGCNAVSDSGVHALSKCVHLKSLMVQRCPLVTERVLAPLRGRLHIDRPSQSYNLPALVNCLYLQV